MTSSTTNTLRITIKLTESRSVSLKPFCICLEKEKDLVEMGEEKGCRGSGWGLVLSVIWPFILMFSVKVCKILMFSVLKKLTVKC